MQAKLVVLLLIFVSSGLGNITNAQESCGNIIYEDGNQEAVVDCDNPFGIPTPNYDVTAAFADTEIVEGGTYPFAGVTGSFSFTNTGPFFLGPKIFLHDGQDYVQQVSGSPASFSFAQAGTYTMVIGGTPPIFSANILDKIKNLIIPTAHAAQIQIDTNLEVITFEVVEPPSEPALPELHYAPGVNFVDDVVDNGKGLHPNKGTAGEDEFNFKVLYQASDNLAPASVSLVTKNTVSFDNDFYPQHLPIDDEDADFTLGGLSIPGFPEGRYLGYKSGFLNQPGFENGDTLVVPVPAGTTEISAEFYLAILGGVDHSVDLQLRALDENQAVLNSATAQVEFGSSPEIATLAVSTLEPMHFIEISTPSTDSAQAFVHEITITRTIPLEREATEEPNFIDGEVYTHSATFPKAAYTYHFTASTIDAQAVELNDNLTFSSGYSSVAFLPGHQASRLYREQFGSNKLWLPFGDGDVEKLYLDELGNSLYDDVYTEDEDIIEVASIARLDVYKGFPELMDSLVNNGTISDWKPLAYDWRLDYDDLLSTGTETDDKIFYGAGNESDEPYILSEIARLASSSDSGKVKLIAHSNGGLLSKKLLYDIEQNDHPYHYLWDYIDQVVLVASPQLGTPEALFPLLHGAQNAYGMLGVEDETIRTFSYNMPSAYHLLPSEAYFSIENSATGTIVFNTPEFNDTIAFRNNPGYTGTELDRVINQQDNYGSAITDSARFSDYVLGVEGRPQADEDDTKDPQKLRETLYRNAEQLHSEIDNWQPSADGPEIIQVAGWGIATPRGVEYFTKSKQQICLDDNSVCQKLPVQSHQKIIPTSFGDETVVLGSAAAMPDVTTYYFDMGGYNLKRRELGDSTERDHSNIIAADPVLSFIFNVIKGDDVDTLSFIDTDRPNGSDFTFLEMHSPVNLHVYDAEGNHTGITVDADTGEEYIEKKIPNSTYWKVGDDTYIALDQRREYRIELDGLDTGTFTFNLTNYQNDVPVRAYDFVDVPVTEVLKGTLTLQSLAMPPVLSLDNDGDGNIDETITPKSEEEQLTIEDQLTLLKADILGLNLKRFVTKSLIKNLAKAEKNYEKKKYGHALKRLILIEKIVKKLKKKKLISTDSAEQMLTTIDRVQSKIKDFLSQPKPRHYGDKNNGDSDD